MKQTLYIFDIFQTGTLVYLLERSRNTLHFFNMHPLLFLIFPQVNDIAFHPVHFCSLATVGSDGKFSFWDRDARTKLKVRT